MKRWVQVLSWLVYVALFLLIGIGVYAWRADQAATPPPVVVTATPAGAQSQPTPTATRTATLTPSPSPSPTQPPELPPTWTPTSTPTRTPSPTPRPTQTRPPPPMVIPTSLPMVDGTPVVTSTLPQPTPMPLIAQPEGTINILALGIDTDDRESVSLTDVILIISIFPDLPGVSMISVPRDYYAWIPTWGLDKINTTYLRGIKSNYPGGGPALIKATIEYNFGLPIHYYAMVDFSSYRSIVDAVGGVDVVVECPFHDTYPDPEVEAGQTDIDMEPGIHHLDGKHALWYVRSRWNTSDFDRHRRQQQVMLAILEKALSQQMIARIPDLWSTYQESVRTDLKLQDLLYLGTVAARLDVRNLKSRFIRGSHLLESGTKPNGGYILIPHAEEMYNFMLEAAQPPVTSRAAQRAYRVAVWNGTGNSSWGAVAAYRLSLEGFTVTEITDVEGTPRTQVVDFTTTSKGSPLYKLLRLYKLDAGEVVSEPTEESPVDFRVTLGWDYDPCVGTVTARWRPTPTPTPTETITPP